MSETIPSTGSDSRIALPELPEELRSALAAAPTAGEADANPISDEPPIVDPSEEIDDLSGSDDDVLPAPPPSTDPAPEPTPSPAEVAPTDDQFHIEDPGNVDDLSGPDDVVAAAPSPASPPESPVAPSAPEAPSVDPAAVAATPVSAPVAAEPGAPADADVTAVETTDEGLNAPPPGSDAAATGDDATAVSDNDPLGLNLPRGGVDEGDAGPGGDSIPASDAQAARDQARAAAGGYHGGGGGGGFSLGLGRAAVASGVALGSIAAAAVKGAFKAPPAILRKIDGGNALDPRSFRGSLAAFRAGPDARLARHETKQAVLAGERVRSIEQKMRTNAALAPVLSRIDSVARTAGVAPSEVIAGMNDGGRYEQLGQEWKKAMENPKAAFLHEKMATSLGDWQDKWDKAMHSASRGGFDANEVKNAFVADARRVQDAVRSVPNPDPEDAGKLKSMEEKIKKFAEAIRNLLRSLFGIGSDAPAPA